MGGIPAPYREYLPMPAVITNAKLVAARVVGDAGWGVWTFTNEIGEGDQKMASETRLTLVFEKVDGKWLVIGAFFIYFDCPSWPS